MSKNYSELMDPIQSPLVVLLLDLAFVVLMSCLYIGNAIKRLWKLIV